MMKKICIKCKVEFIGSNNRKRCNKCQAEYRKTYDKDKKRDKRDYKTTHSRSERKRSTTGGYYKRIKPSWKDNDGKWHDERLDAEVKEGFEWGKLEPREERIAEYEHKFENLRACKSPEEEEQEWMKHYLNSCRANNRRKRIIQQE